MKGQVSTELLVVVALVLLIFIPLLVMVYMKANEATQQIGSYQAELAVSRVVSLANSVGSLGTNTTVTTDVYLPPDTVSFDTIAAGSGSEIVLKTRTPSGITETADIVRYPLVSYGQIIPGELVPGGVTKIKISSYYIDGQARVKIEKVSS
jgi:uncharacterized protein (UPF0333 family)